VLDMALDVRKLTVLQQAEHEVMDVFFGELPL
jgi:hypothetical protein